MHTDFKGFPQAINYTEAMLKSQAVKYHRGKWQGQNVASRPDAATYELHHVTLRVPSNNNLEFLRKEIEPNIPWADDHFMERVSGNPLNPGIEWANWPWGKSADKSRLSPESIGDPGPEKVFDHTYAQRYWPCYAGRYSGGILPQDYAQRDVRPHRGIYFEYGDLNGVIEELVQDPTTRQAILPVFFPEDTGYRPGRRKPCSLFYHFMLTNSGLDISYQLRSCDYVHHFRDDIYLTVRLQLWVLDRLREREVFWQGVAPGLFVMQIANLHCFINDYHALKQA